MSDPAKTGVALRRAPGAARMRPFPRAVWAWAAVGLALRLALAWGFDNLQHADEIGQSLEQAHRLVFGVGFVPWEFRHGLRSWLLPLLLAGPLALLDAVGLGHPDFYVPAIEGLLATWGAVAIPAAAVWAFWAAGPTAAVWCAGLVAIEPVAATMAGRALPDALALPLVPLALALAWAPQTPRRDRLLGLVVGVGVWLRVAWAPLFALPLLRRWWITHDRVGVVRRAAVGAIAVAAVTLTVDAATWGWGSSWWRHLLYNTRYEVGVLFGTEPAGWVPLTLLILSGGLVAAALAAAAWVRAARWPAAMVVLLAAAHMLPAHKEARFLAPAFALALMALAVAVARRRLLRRVVAVWALLVFVGVSAALIPGVRERITPPLGQDPVLRVYAHLARVDDVRAVLDGVRAWGIGGHYYRLHHAVPLYTGHDVARLERLAPPRAFVSHAIVPAGTPRWPQFATAMTADGIELRQRTAGAVRPPPPGWLPLPPQPGVDGVIESRVRPWPDPDAMRPRLRAGWVRTQ